jgi:hypothetical protein
VTVCSKKYEIRTTAVAADTTIFTTHFFCAVRRKFLHPPEGVEKFQEILFSFLNATQAERLSALSQG